MALSSTILDLIDAEIGTGPASLRGKLRFVLEITLYNKNTPGTEKIYVSDKGVYTSSTDTPANTQMLPRLIVPSFEASLYGSGTALNHLAPLILGEARIINNDGYYDAYLNFEDYSWAYRNASLKVGNVDSAYTTYETIPGGVVKMIQPTADEDYIRIPFTQYLDDLNRPVQKNIYGGFAGSLKISVPNGGGTYAVIGNEYDGGIGDFTVEMRFKAATGSAVRRLLSKKDTANAATDAGWCLYLDASDNLRFRISDGSNGAAPTISSACVGNGWHHCAAVVDRANDELSVYFDGALVGSATDISSVTGDITCTDDCAVGGDDAGSDYLQADDELDEFRFWRKARTAQEIETDYDQTRTGSEKFLEGLYKMDEYANLGSDYADAVLIQEVEGPTTDSLSFVGGLQDDYIDFGDIFDVAADEDLTVGIWFKTTSASSEMILLSKKNGTATAGWALGVDASTGYLKGHMRDGSSNTGEATLAVSDLADGTWQAAALVIDRTLDELRVYHLDKQHGTLDSPVGAEIADISSVGAIATATEMRASRYAGGSAEFAGQLSWAFAVKAILSDAEIKTCLMTQVSPEYDDGLNSSGDTDDIINDATASWWPMDEGTGTDINDVINSVNGSTSGSPGWQDKDGTLTFDQWGSTLEGMNDLAGLPKVLTYGRCRSIPCPLIDWGFYYWGVHEGAVKAIKDVYAGGLKLSGGTVPSDDYETTNASGYFELASTYDGHEITADVHGEMDANDNLIRHASDILEEIMVEKCGISSGDIDTASFQAYKEEFPWDVGVFLGTEENTLAEIAEFLLRPRGYLYVDLTGKIKIKAIRDMSGESADYFYSHATGDIVSMDLIGFMPPAWKVKVGFGRKWKVITEFYSAVDGVEQARQGMEYQYKAAKDADVRTADKDAAVLTYDTALYKAGDAMLEAQELFRLYSKRLGIYRVRLAKDMFRPEIGDIVNITYDRFNLDSGADLSCIGFKYNIASSPPLIELTLLGPISYTPYIDPIR